MAELIPNALNSDLPNYWKDISGIDYNIKIDDTYYGKTQFYFNSASYANFRLLSEYDWDMGDPCGEGVMGALSVHLNNFFTFLRGVQKFNNTYIVGSINMIQNIAGEIKKVSSAIASILRTLISRVRNWILNKIRELIDAALDAILTPLTKQIKEGLLQTLIEQLMCSFDDIIDGLVDFVGDFLYALVGQVVQTPLCAIENYLNAMINRLSSDIEDAIDPILNQLGNILGGALSVVGQVNGVINQILGFESFFCSRPECPDVKNFKASIWGGPTPSAIANFQNFTASPTGFVANAQTKAEEWLANFFGPSSNTSQSPGSCYTGTFKCGVPQIVIFGGGGSGAVANAVVNNIGQVIGVNLLNGGSGYKSPPFVSIVDPAGCGINASATAVLCPPSSKSSPRALNGYTTPGIYLDLRSVPSSAITNNTVTVTLELVKDAASTYGVSIPGKTSSGIQIPPLPSVFQDKVPIKISLNLVSGNVYGPIVLTNRGISGTAELYVGNEVVNGILGSGSLSNRSIVVEEDGDDWNDLVITTDYGFFAKYNSPTITPSTSSSSTSSVCSIYITNPGSNYSAATNNGAPLISSFVGSPNPTNTNNTITLSWSVVNATSVSLNVPGFNNLPLNGSISLLVNPSFPVGQNQTTVTYTLTATNTQLNSTPQVVTRNFILTVNKPFASSSIPANNAPLNTNTPTINTFTANPNSVTVGSIVKLDWDTTDALTASLTASGLPSPLTGYGSIPVDGTLSFIIPSNMIFPAAGNATIDYTLTASNPNASGNKTSSQTVSVTVTQPVPLAPGAPPAPPAPPPAPPFVPPVIGGLTCTPSSFNLNEGDTVNFNVTANNPANNGVFFYEIVSLSGKITADDFTDKNLTGAFIVNNNVGTITKTISNDLNTEGVEQFNLIIKRNQAFAAIEATSGSITIFDTSNTPLAPVPPLAPALASGFTCVANTTNLNEGDTVDFVVTSTDSKDNGTFFYQIIPISSSLSSNDFTDNILSGSFVINNNIGTISKTIRLDLSTERIEEFYLIIKRQQASNVYVAISQPITINDTSVSSAIPPIGPGAPAVAVIGGVAINNTGNGYSSSTTISIKGGNNGAILKPQITPSGQIVGIQIVNPGYGFTRVPELEINSREGLGAKLRVNLEFIPLDQFLRDQNIKSIDQTKLVRIIDCVSR